ncbi:MAG TPA: COX15/CtaA family protein [Terriglobales bacterium]|nr:COX15/CtaA family protein [Terriglobales bacterium]
MKPSSTPYNSAHHWFAVFVACATFILLIAGALVTSNDAGLSIPDWPTSFGSFSVPHLHGGVQYEWSHRAIAFSTGLLTVGIAVWTWISDHRLWMKGLGLAALATIISQGILGGLTVLYFQPPMVSSAHAAVAQTFFCIACAIALFTSRSWVQNTPVQQTYELTSDSGHPSLLTLSFLSIFILYAQLILGAMFRHHGMSWLPHVLNAPVVAIVITWTAVRALSRYSKDDAIRRSAIVMLSLLIAQLFLGFLAFMTRVEWGRDAAQPEFPMVVSTVAHVVTGALLLALTVILTIQVWRNVPAAGNASARSEDREPVAA